MEKYEIHRREGSFRENVILIFRRDYVEPHGKDKRGERARNAVTWVTAQEKKKYVR